MKKHYGYIAKDKSGDFWLSTLTGTKLETKEHTEDVETQWGRDKFNFKIVKVKLTEVGE